MKKKLLSIKCNSCGRLWSLDDLRSELASLTAGELKAAGWKLSRNGNVILFCPDCENPRESEKEKELRATSLGSLSDMIGGDKEELGKSENQ